jgi:hypothetical protein
MNHIFEKYSYAANICPWDLIIIDGDERIKYYIHYDSKDQQHYAFLNMAKTTHLDYLISNSICQIIEIDPTFKSAEIKVVFDKYALLAFI